MTDTLDLYREHRSLFKLFTQFYKVPRRSQRQNDPALTARSQKQPLSCGEFFETMFSYRLTNYYFSPLVQTLSGDGGI